MPLLRLALSLALGFSVTLAAGAVQGPPPPPVSAPAARGTSTLSGVVDLGDSDQPVAVQLQQVRPALGPVKKPASVTRNGDRE
jgi:hypothetical protein